MEFHSIFWGQYISGVIFLWLDWCGPFQSLADLQNELSVDDVVCWSIHWKPWEAYHAGICKEFFPIQFQSKFLMEEHLVNCMKAKQGYNFLKMWDT